MKCWNPECFNELSARATSCPVCGWDSPRKKGAVDAVDPYHGRCENVELGQRCANAGSLSHSTRGGGPWYCRQHFFPNDPHQPTRPTEFAFAMLEEEEKRNDGRDWARLIMKRKAAGEILPIISLETATEALNATASKRQPGEDEATAERIAIQFDAA